MGALNFWVGSKDGPHFPKIRGQRQGWRQQKRDNQRNRSKKKSSQLWYLLSSRRKLYTGAKEKKRLDFVPPTWETYWNKVLGTKAPRQPRAEPSAALRDPPCVQFLQTAGRCSSCLPSSPLRGLSAPRARSRPGSPSALRWSRCRPLNGGCCFLKRDRKSIRSWLGWPTVTPPPRVSTPKKQGGSDSGKALSV